MAFSLFYLIFCQLIGWLALLARRQASKDADRSPGRDPPGRTGPRSRR
jgi:hypothetical protein